MSPLPSQTPVGIVLWCHRQHPLQWTWSRTTLTWTLNRRIQAMGARVCLSPNRRPSPYSDHHQGRTNSVLFAVWIAAPLISHVGIAMLPPAMSLIFRHSCVNGKEAHPHLYSNL